MASRTTSLGSVANRPSYDERAAVARKNGLFVSGLQAGLGRNQLIIGCVGKSCLPKNAERHIRDGAIIRGTRRIELGLGIRDYALRKLGMFVPGPHAIKGSR